MFNSQQFSKDLKIQKARYKLSQDLDLATIEQHLTQLQKFDLRSLKNDNAKKAFWINVYNGMTNYVIITMGIQSSMKEINGVFRKKIVSISNVDFSLDDIEHGILRKNKRNVFTLNDKKLSLMVDALDYRIHFALNCGATSCPIVSFYSEENIDQELNWAEDTFVEHEFLVDQKQKLINCSQIFERYKEDFKGRFLEDLKYSGFKILLKDYDWSIWFLY